MESPFPGMDPYLEGHWGDVHTSLIVYARNQINAQLPNDLQARVEESLAVEVDELGFNLHFPALDVDLYVPALVSGIFGTRAWMTRELARIAGRTKSAAKASAARANGAKGGRPRKVARG